MVSDWSNERRAPGNWKVSVDSEEECCSGMQPHKAIYDLLGSSSICTCMDRILISIPKIENIAVGRTHSKSQNDHQVAHMWDGS